MTTQTLPTPRVRTLYTGQVVSVKEKHGDFGPYFGITVRLSNQPRGAKASVWFRRSLDAQEKQTLRHGDLVDVVGTVDGMTADASLTFLKRAIVTISGHTCTHENLSRQSGFYACVCGETFAVTKRDESEAA